MPQTTNDYYLQRDEEPPTTNDDYVVAKKRNGGGVLISWQTMQAQANYDCASIVWFTDSVVTQCFESQPSRLAWFQCNSKPTPTFMQGWGLECWLDPAKGGWVGGREGFLQLNRQNPRFPFHVFRKMLIPYSRFSRIDMTDLKDCSARAFSDIPDC